MHPASLAQGDGESGSLERLLHGTARVVKLRVPADVIFVIESVRGDHGTVEFLSGARRLEPSAYNYDPKEFEVSRNAEVAIDEKQTLTLPAIDPRISRDVDGGEVLAACRRGVFSVTPVLGISEVALGADEAGLDLSVGARTQCRRGNRCQCVEVVVAEGCQGGLVDRRIAENWGNTI